MTRQKFRAGESEKPVCPRSYLCARDKNSSPVSPVSPVMQFELSRLLLHVRTFSMSHLQYIQWNPDKWDTFKWDFRLSGIYPRAPISITVNLTL